MHSNGGRGSCCVGLVRGCVAEVCEDMMLTLVVGALTVDTSPAEQFTEMNAAFRVGEWLENSDSLHSHVPVASSCGGVRASPMRKGLRHQARKSASGSSRRSCP